MASLIIGTRVVLPPHLTKLDERSFIQFMVWHRSVRLLKEHIIKPVKAGILVQSKFNPANKPSEQTVEIFQSGAAKVRVTSLPARRERISYKQAYSVFEGFINFLIDQYESKASRPGIRTINDEPYISIHVLQRMLRLYIRRNTSVSEESEESEESDSEERAKGFKQSIKLLEPHISTYGVPQTFEIVFQGRRYDIFSETNVGCWAQAQNMIGEGDRRTIGFDEGDVHHPRFKELLKADTLQNIGVWPKEPSRIAYSYGHYSFEHQVEPRVRPQYSVMLDELSKPIPGIIKTNSHIGDFEILERWQESLIISVLTKKGFIDDQFRADYNPEAQGGKIFVRLKGVRDRLKQYREEHQNPNLEQNIIIDPESLLGPWLNETLAAAASSS